MQVLQVPGCIALGGGFLQICSAVSSNLGQLLLKLNRIYFTVIQDALITETESFLVRKCSQFSLHLYY